MEARRRTSGSHRLFCVRARELFAGKPRHKPIHEAGGKEEGEQQREQAEEQSEDGLYQAFVRRQADASDQPTNAGVDGVERQHANHISPQKTSDDGDDDGQDAIYERRRAVGITLDPPWRRGGWRRILRWILLGILLRILWAALVWVALGIAVRLVMPSSLLTQA